MIRPISEAYGDTYLKAGQQGYFTAVDSLRRSLTEWHLEAVESGDDVATHRAYVAAKQLLVHAHRHREINKTAAERLLRMRREFIKWKKD